MTKTENLTDQTVAALARMGATVNLAVKDALITATDKWGENWTALVAEDASTLDFSTPDEQDSSGRFVLVVPKGQESEVRARVDESLNAGSFAGPPNRLVWGF